MGKHFWLRRQLFFLWYHTNDKKSTNLNSLPFRFCTMSPPAGHGERWPVEGNWLHHCQTKGNPADADSQSESTSQDYAFTLGSSASCFFVLTITHSSYICVFFYFFCSILLVIYFMGKLYFFQNIKDPPQTFKLRPSLIPFCLISMNATNGWSLNNTWVALSAFDLQPQKLLNTG